jgi:5-methylcytosine-specific restriction endonuclease McrA
VSSGSSCCTCERYGITRAGDRVKLDCGGARCGYSDDSSDCSSEDEYHQYEQKTTRRQGVVIRS